MKISIDFDGVQENKQYNFSFCLSTDGDVILTTKTENISKNNDNKKKPSLEDFEEDKNKRTKPTLEEPVINKKKDFKVESSFDGKISEGKKV